MKQFFLPFYLVCMGLGLLMLNAAQRSPAGRALPANRQVNNQLITGCAPPAALAAVAGADGRYAPVFPGWGHYSYRVQTTSDSAQFFFNQGLNLYYSYHLTEALASFREAARFDSTCVMAYWGQALSMGPYYNNYFYKMPPAVLPVLVQMNRLADAATGKEKDLVEAMNKRYTTDTADRRRQELNRAYSLQLAALIQKYPADADIKALYVDAVMLEHPWDFWASNGSARPWTTALVSYCDDILQQQPAHPAALHYKIHLVEASHHPAQALAAADLLKNSLPGVPHMVHMSSHMYQRNGYYTRGVEVNDRATALQVQYNSMATHLRIGLFPLTHFDAVSTYCALHANMYRKSRLSALHLRSMLQGSYRDRLSNTFFQYLYMMPMLSCVRSGKWEQALREPAPDSSLVYATLLDAFGKGIASLRRNDQATAGQYLQRMRLLMSDGSLKVVNPPFNTAYQGALIAESILSGEYLLAANRSAEAIRSFENAVAAEDSLIYREPKEWPIPARHYLGACLLKLDKPAAAEKVYREDLALNPGNGWALLGLYQSLLKQHKTKAAKTYRIQYRRAFSGADELPLASVY
jgi:tetratricopeptide (TPR) repeat protein